MKDIFKSLPPRWQFLLPYLALIATIFLAYINVYNNDFLFDDGLTITLNTYLQSWAAFGKLLTQSTTAGAHIAGGFYRPMQMLLYFLIYQTFGANTFAFHFLNIALHAANACLIITLGRKLDFNLAASFLAALLWALHPIHTEAVTYMSATADPLFAFFCLLGLIILLPDFTLRKILLSVPVFLLALLSKETAVAFPLLVIVTLYFTSPDRFKPKTYLRTAPLWLVMGLYLCWRLTSLSFDGPATYERLYQLPAYQNLALYAQHFSPRFYTFFATLPAYLGLLLWPHGLHMERDFMVYTNFWNPPVLEGIALCLAAASWIIFARGKRGAPLGWGLLWFGAAHAPDSGLLAAGNAMFLEHWMYLPTIGLFLGGAESISRALSYSSPLAGEVRWGGAQQSQSAGQRSAPSPNPSREGRGIFRLLLQRRFLKTIIAVLALIIAVILGFATCIQNMVWHDPVTFYSHMFKYGVTSARAHNNLGIAYMDRHEYTEAIAEFHKAIDLTDVYAETHHNLAVCLLNLPDQGQHVEEAIHELNRALEIDPNFVRSYVALADVYTYLGDRDKAAAYQKKADEILSSTH